MDENKYFEWFGVSISAICGLISLACISALPSVSCAALAETYTHAIVDFGGCSLLGSLLVFSIKAEVFGRTWAHTATSYINVAAAMVFVFGTGLAAVANLSAATEICFVGSNEQLAARIHQPFKAYTPWNSWRVISIDRK